jgi:RimJ/RimL family protein N-acetyltransferase
MSGEIALMAKVTVKSSRKGRETARPVRLESARLSYLTPPPIECAGDIAGWFQDPEIGRYLDRPPATVRRAEAAIRNTNNGNRFLFGVFPKGVPTIIGYTQVSVSKRHSRAKTNSVIGDRSYWGGRYAIEMRTAVLDFLFRSCELHKVASYVYGRNIPSIFNNKALGYTCESILRDQEIGPEGEFRDLVCFGILREEWLAREREQ